MSYIILEVNSNDFFVTSGGNYDPNNPTDPTVKVIFSTKNGYLFKSPDGSGIVKFPGGKTIEAAVVGNSPTLHYKFGSVDIKAPGDGPTAPGFTTPPLNTFSDSENASIEGLPNPLRPTAVEPPVGNDSVINTGWIDTGGP